MQDLKLNDNKALLKYILTKTINSKNLNYEKN
jgi:hypothetical protein